MPDEPLLERVARAIDPEAWLAIDDGRDALPDSLWHIRRTIAFLKARAALDTVLAAMREPSTRMVEAAHHVSSAWSSEMIRTWKAMLAAFEKEHL